MKIRDLAGEEIEVTDLVQAIEHVSNCRLMQVAGKGFEGSNLKKKAYWEDVYEKLIKLKKEEAIRAYFHKSYERAHAKYLAVNRESNQDRHNAGFINGGHMRKGYANRINRLIDKVHRVSMKTGLRKIFWLISQLDILYEDKKFVVLMREILDGCNLHKSPYDKYNYLEVSFPGTPGPKQVQAVKNFVEVYGNKTDKRYLLPYLSV